MTWEEVKGEKRRRVETENGKGGRRRWMISLEARLGRPKESVKKSKRTFPNDPFPMTLSSSNESMVNDEFYKQNPYISSSSDTKHEAAAKKEKRETYMCRLEPDLDVELSRPSLNHVPLISVRSLVLPSPEVQYKMSDL
jgi:hypothetical protein